MTRARAAEVLGVELDAEPDDVQAAFRQHALAHHPDRGGDQDQLEDAVIARRVLLGPQATGRRARSFYQRVPWWRQRRARRAR